MTTIAHRIVLADTPEMRSAELAVRWEVFVVEQGVPLVLEMDARDQREDVDHLVALPEKWRSGDPVLGCVRIIPDGVGEDGRTHVHLGRLAVRREARGTGLGAALVRAVHQRVADLTPCGREALVVLDAQVQAQGFYEALGYRTTTGEVFLDAGIEHREMALVVPGRSGH
ncbi:GNAT family N-acetyltransferase [Schaalia sp. 19OD2882]|uniref:GNAT family N-acetyltransferase n=1 Tax=Schaalia sp. 19OD2882 TaxID=2794089 RepID=UPI001C1EAB49|nr:GNAT family N-acetyltransferase [Schaalia sp. 19OD2882]QWW18932.1 GNAT family N-acetyltransferase [Schaalia sp. 19OD2882]